MNQSIGALRPVSRRLAQDPRMLARVSAELARVTVDVHRRRVQVWALAGDGDYPTLAESRRIAVDELALLAGALGSLVAIEPGRFIADATLAKRRAA